MSQQPDPVVKAVMKAPPAFLRRQVPRPVFTALIGLGIALRLWVSTFGYNFDLQSWAIVASVLDSGGNVYAETARYNYAPVWIQVIGVASWFSSLFDDEIGAFGLFFTLLLTAVDVGLCLLLRRKGGDMVALLFFLNPISILISGHHRQFGNLALLLGLVAAHLFDRSDPDRLDSKAWLGMLVLGLSLTTKHLLFALPWWLALKRRRLVHGLVVFTVPVALFLASFLPYWSEGSDGIVQNVFLYRFVPNAPLWNGWMPPLIADLVPATVGLLAALTLGGLVLRKVAAFPSVLLYTALLVVASPAMANQYFALVAPFLAWFLNVFAVVYVIGATALLLVSPDGLHLTAAVDPVWLYTSGVSWLVAPLFAALVWVFARDRIVSGVRRIRRILLP